MLHQVKDAADLRNVDGYWYVATPYSKFPGGIEEAYGAAMDLDAKLEWACVKRFSPIIYSHQICRESGINPLDHRFWMAWDRPMMERAYGLLVGKLPGWEESVGVQDEIQYFEEGFLPVFLIDPDDFDWVHQ